MRTGNAGASSTFAAVESRATTIDALLEEMRLSRASERQGRLIDRDGAAAMERKKREGYF